jgi:hypothetical protein
LEKLLFGFQAVDFLDKVLGFDSVQLLQQVLLRFLQSVQFQRDVALRVLKSVRGGAIHLRSDHESTRLEVRNLIDVCFESRFDGGKVSWLLRRRFNEWRHGVM